MIALANTLNYDCILVGGGLQSGLLALAIDHFHPDARVLIIERGPELGGNHTWSFHPGDVPTDCLDWINPLVQYRWSNYEVRLRGFGRTVGLEYASIASDHFASIIHRVCDRRKSKSSPAMTRVVEMATVGNVVTCGNRSQSPAESAWRQDAASLGWHLLTDTEAVTVNKDEVVTGCGQSFGGELVIDCRGPQSNKHDADCGFQKFWGFELELDKDWPDEYPAVMESVEDQRDGFRFLYTLPFDRRRVLVEDTRFSDTPNLDRAECWSVVKAYLRRRGMDGFRIIREESGVLPMPFTNQQTPSADAPLAGGYAGGWFHAATGYSFPMAVAFAHAVASGPLSDAAARVQQLSQQHRWRSRYSRFLNRLLFRLVTPAKRERIFRRFYQVLNDEAVERFYSHQFRPLDAFRIIVGVPPTVSGLRPFQFLGSFFSGVSS